MGRIKLEQEIKKVAISLSLESEIFEKLESLEIKNKSQLINWLLREHFQLNNQITK